MKYIKYVILLILVFLGSYYIYQTSIDKAKTTKSPEDDLGSINDLIVIAHPGDEVIWASRLLNKEETLIICVSCGTNGDTDEEFKEVAKLNKNKYKFLNIPTHQDEIYDDWINSYDIIEKEIDAVLRSRHWEKIYTYSPDNIADETHHRILSRITTQSAIRQRLSNNLYYFAPYFSEEEEKEVNLSEEELEEKNELMNNYISLEAKKAKFQYLFAHEEIIKYR